MAEHWWRPIVRWFFAGLAAFVLAYVVFVHIQSASRRMSPDVRDFEEALGASGALPSGYEIRTQGALRPSVEHGVLTVTGAAHAGDSLVFAAPLRRFDDTVLTFRFRVPESTEGLETFLGLEQPGGHTFSATFVSGAEPFVVAGGDLSSPTRRTMGDMRLPMPAAAGEEHVLTLQFTPAVAAASVLFDAHPVATFAVGWGQGTEARIVFGARARADVAKVATELLSLRLQTVEWAVPQSFDDHFGGAIIDTKRWFFNDPDPAVAKCTSQTEKGQGLALEATVHGFTSDPSFACMLRTAPLPLRPLHIRLEMRIDELTNATLFFGLMGTGQWIPEGRVFDTGITKRGDNAFRFVAGAWTNDGKLTFDRGLDTTVPQDVVVDFDYDTDRRIGRVRVNNEPPVEHPLDLKPLDPIVFRIGALGHAPGARARAHIHRIALDIR